MALPIYTKARKLCNKVIELHALLCESRIIQNKRRFKIRSYQFEFDGYNQVSQCRPGGYDYHLLYSTSVRTGTNYEPYIERHGGYQIRVHDFIDERYRKHTEENEFQLLMLDDEYTLFKKYCKVMLQDFYSTTNERTIYLNSTDSIRYTAAIKAIKDVLDAHRNGKFI